MHVRGHSEDISDLLCCAPLVVCLCQKEGDPVCGCVSRCVVCTGCVCVGAGNCLLSVCPVCFCAWGAAVCLGASGGARLPTPRVTPAASAPRTLYSLPSPGSTQRVPEAFLYPGPQAGQCCHSAPGRHHATPGSPDVGQGCDSLALVGPADAQLPSGRSLGCSPVRKMHQPVRALSS